MELGTTLGFEIALVIGLISIVLFQLSSNIDRQQKVSAGIIVGLYILMFGLMAIFALPYLTKSCLVPELTIFERIFLPNFQIQITEDEIDSLINTQVMHASIVLVYILFLAFKKYKKKIIRADVKTPVMVAFIIVLVVNLFYGNLSRLLFKLQSTIWLQIIYGIYGGIVIFWANKYIDKKIDIANNFADKDDEQER